MHLAVLREPSQQEFFFAPEEVMMVGVTSLLIAALIAGVTRAIGRKKKHSAQLYVLWLFLGSGVGLCVLALVLIAFDDRPPFH